MKIKDVEMLTGLTAKTIRFYESKNLITPKRNEENSYRNYTDEDVARLRWIKMLRYLDFSIEEIESLLTKNVGETKEALKQKADELSKLERLSEDKRDICLFLAKDYGNNESVIEFLESDEMKEFKEQAEEIATPNLVSAIVFTLIFIAPVFWLFYNIKAERTDFLMYNGIFALTGTALLTWNWIHFARAYRRNRDRIKEKTRKRAWLIPAMILGIILTVVAVFALLFAVSHWILPGDYLFFEYGPFTGKILILLVLITVFLLCLFVIGRRRKKPAEDSESTSGLPYLWRHLGKWRGIVIVALFIALYCCMFNFTAVTGNKIICYTPINPSGTVYDYADVDSVTTGFGDKNLAFADYKRKGSFYYRLDIDGRTVTFHQPSINGDIKRYEEDTYLELEEFDQALVSLQIPKKASKKGWENCDFDKKYVDRFLRILSLK